MVEKIRKNPAITRYAREKLEQELAVRFLTGKISHIRKCLEDIVLVKNPSQRYLMTQHLLSDVMHLEDALSIKHPHRNLTFYMHRKI